MKIKKYLVAFGKLLLLVAGVISLALLVAFIFNKQESSLSQEDASKEEATPSLTQSQAKSNASSLNVPPSIPSFISKAVSNNNNQPTITLAKANTIVFRGVVTSDSMGKLEQQLNEMSHSLDHTIPIYLVLDSPGGEVEAGLTFIDMAKAVPQEVKTITMFSASMAFHIVENLGERLVTPNGVLMSHRLAIGGLEGHIPGEAVVRLNRIIREANLMDGQVAKRIGMKLEDYQALIRDEYWVSGGDGVNDHMADRVVLINCGFDLNDSYTQNIPTPFGVLRIEWSSCPTIAAPLSTNAQDILTHITNASDRQAFAEFLNTYFNDKEQFVHRYIVNRSYKRIINE